MARAGFLHWRARGGVDDHARQPNALQQLRLRDCRVGARRVPPAKGDSHFFGRGTTECDATAQSNPTSVLEDGAFMQMVLPAAGACPPGTGPSYRVFSNRADTNHRYMTDRAVRDQMVARGWIAEGDGPDLVVMCAAG